MITIVVRVNNKVTPDVAQNKWGKNFDLYDNPIIVCRICIFKDPEWYSDAQDELHLQR